MLNTKKMIATVEKMKKDVASMRKEADAEVKRVEKTGKALETKLAKLREKLSKLPPSTEPTAKSEKLLKEIDDLLTTRAANESDDSALGFAIDTDHDESVIGALHSIGEALDELFKGKGKKRSGHLVRYQEALDK